MGGIGSLKAHVDSHLAGALRGTPSREWLQGKGWSVCSGCGLTACASRGAGTHTGCAARARVGDSLTTGDDEVDAWTQKLDNLPVIADVFKEKCATKEFTNKGLRWAYRQEYMRLVARVVQYNVSWAWGYMQSPVGTGTHDTVAMKQCMACWIEMSMFPKAVLRGHKRGLRPAHAYAISNSRLDRWVAGERMELWDELGQGRRARGGGDTTVKRRHEAVGKLAALGRPGKAIHRLISPGLASNTRKTACSTPCSG